MDSDPTPWAERRCLWCDTLLPLERDPRRKFCDNGRACQTAYYNDLRAGRLLLERMDKTCRECGATFTREKSRAIYCSRACAVKAAHKAQWARKLEARGLAPDTFAKAREAKRAQIAEALRRHPTASNGQIGRMLGVSHHTVKRIRGTTPE